MTDRAGLPETAAPDDVRDALVDQLSRWRQRAEHPLASRPVVDAALVIARTCEGLLAAGTIDSADEGALQPDR